MQFPNIYKGDYRLLAIPPLLLLLLSVYFLPQVKLGVEFTGGTLVTFTSDRPVASAEVETIIKATAPSAEVKVFETPRGHEVEILLPQDERFARAEALKENFSIQAQSTEQAAYAASLDPASQPDYEIARARLDQTADAMFAMARLPVRAAGINRTTELRSQFLSAYTGVYEDYRNAVTRPLSAQFAIRSLSIQTVSPTLSLHFIDIATRVVIASGILSIILVFLFFRTLVPSLAVILGAFCDVLIALGAMGLLGIPLTLPSFAALLMLIGFSLDTDILLTTRMLKRKGNPRDNAYDAMRTGTTMSVTAMIAFGVLFALALFTRIPTYMEISSVALAGLAGDVFATWGINAVLVLFYLERKSHGRPQ